MKHNKKILLTALMPFCFFLQNAAAHEGHSHTDGAPSVANDRRQARMITIAPVILTRSKMTPCHSWKR